MRHVAPSSSDSASFSVLQKFVWSTRNAPSAASPHPREELAIDALGYRDVFTEVEGDRALGPIDEMAGAARELGGYWRLWRVGARIVVRH